jgi:hypothetical protein
MRFQIEHSWLIIRLRVFFQTIQMYIKEGEPYWERGRKMTANSRSARNEKVFMMLILLAG